MNRLVLLTLPPPHCLRSYFKFIRHLPPYSPPSSGSLRSLLYVSSTLNPLFPQLQLPPLPTPPLTHSISILPQQPYSPNSNSLRPRFYSYSPASLFQLPPFSTPLPYSTSIHPLPFSSPPSTYGFIFLPPPSLRNADECLVVVKRWHYIPFPFLPLSASVYSSVLISRLRYYMSAYLSFTTYLSVFICHSIYNLKSAFVSIFDSISLLPISPFIHNPKVLPLSPNWTLHRPLWPI